MASREIADLAPRMRILCNAFKAGAKQAGFDIVVISTYRSNAEQQALYDRGRKWPGMKVTMAQPGESPHNCEINGEPGALAFDFVPVFNGKPCWETGSEYLPMWEKLGIIGERLGLEWAGRWKSSLVEYGHFQLKDWRLENEANNFKKA